MKSRLCPYRSHCHDAGECETCDFEKAFVNLNNKIKRLKSKNQSLQEENERLKARIDVLTNPNF